MLLHFKGKFDGDNSKLPKRVHEKTYVKFDEPDNIKTLGPILALLTLVPHEFMHAICFKKDVYLFSNLSKGMLFVTGTETMSKGRAIFMNLLPNIVFAFILFIIFLIGPASPRLNDHIYYRYGCR